MKYYIFYALKLKYQLYVDKLVTLYVSMNLVHI